MPPLPRRCLFTKSGKHVITTTVGRVRSVFASLRCFNPAMLPCLIKKSTKIIFHRQSGIDTAVVGQTSSAAPGHGVGDCPPAPAFAAERAWIYFADLRRRRR